MEYATITTKYCCGIDLHARSMYVCIMDRSGEIKFHRNMQNQVLVQVRHHDRTALSILLTVPGLGRILALTILYEIHTITRFKSAGHFSSYSRLVNVERESAGKKVKGGHPKIGNPHLKWAFTEIILIAQRASTPIKKHYEKLQSKRCTFGFTYLCGPVILCRPSPFVLPPKSIPTI